MRQPVTVTLPFHVLASFGAVVAFFTLVMLLLAHRAGRGSGAADTYERLRPERIAWEFHADAMELVREAQAMHDLATDELTALARETAVPRTEAVPDVGC